nr:FAD binding domain-containing protein [Mycolicibacterium komanii]CRL69131.1 aerobic-type carbon monoxide dehydrogenase, middle subunit CoxM/CutM-like protein [Mycolicibacterium komanii]
MDIDTITELVHRPGDPPGARWRPGDAFLAGGTWLYSEQQPDLRRLIDLAPLGWDSLVADHDGLHIGAMCTIQQLHDLTPPGHWLSGSLPARSCEAFLASFKVWKSATVGGNICMSLPAGPMITMTVAMEATYTLRSAEGSERVVDAADFVTGNHRNILWPGEALRSIDIPAHALQKRYAMRHFALTRLGRSTIFVVGTRTPHAEDLLLTVTAATSRPVRMFFDHLPHPDEVAQQLLALPDALWFDDANGTPDHRRHLALHYAEEIRAELDGAQTL